MPQLVLIGLGGCLGAISRYLLSGLAHRLYSGGLFPVGTLLVNVAGCFVIGALMGLIEDKSLFGPSVRLLFVVGFLGSFTTFSSFGYETVELLRNNQMVLAGVNMIANFALGISAVLLGRLAALTVF